MNPLATFTRKALSDIIKRLDTLMPISISSKKPSDGSLKKPYLWYEILDTKTIEEDDTESVILNTTIYNNEYEYAIRYLEDGKTESLTNARNSEKEITGTNDVVVEILGDN